MSNKLKLVIVAIISCLITLLITYVVVKTTYVEPEPEIIIKEQPSSELIKCKNKAVAFDNKKNIGKKTPEVSYSIISKELDGFSVKIENSKAKVYYYDSLAQMVEYGVIKSEDDSKMEKLENNNYSIDITTKKSTVIDGKMIGIGQNSSYSALFMIMEDGSVEYLKLKAIIEGGNSQGSIEGVNNIVRVEQANIGYNQGGGAVTAIAIDADGNFYDLNNYIDMSIR
ncbi:hypothetical protein [Mycoplasma sp. P36-A1]|uniref:hypothetical protein n=1 Tax=Mycoplasma sp. P36-A1 TaxID=3252900 RepID=UPI003C2B10EF